MEEFKIKTLTEQDVVIIAMRVTQEILDAQSQTTSKVFEPKYLTIKETAKRLKLSKGTVNSLANRGILNRHRIGGSVLFLTDEVDRAVHNGSAVKYGRR